MRVRGVEGFIWGQLDKHILEHGKPATFVDSAWAKCEAIAWCHNHQLSAVFSQNRVLLYTTNEDGPTSLGKGTSLVEAVHNARKEDR